MPIVKIESIRPAPWKATYIFKPDLKMLEDSIAADGMQYPILVRQETSEIIDGFARWVAKQNLGHKTVEIEFVDKSEVDSMVMHVQINRGRGQVVAKDLSNLIQRCLRSKVYEYDELRKKLNMTIDEYDILADGALVKRRKLKEHKYSNAWVPVETSGYAEKPDIERPKTPDR
jgi:ParB-like chromosome segregation protein Spo0J